MRQIAQRLRHALEFLRAQLVEHQREKDGRGKAEEEVQPGNDERIGENVLKIVAAEKALIVGESDPWAARYAAQQLKILKCKRNAVQRPVTEKQIPAHDRQNHRQVQPVLSHCAKELPASVLPVRERGMVEGVHVFSPCRSNSRLARRERRMFSTPT